MKDCVARKVLTYDQLYLLEYPNHQISLARLVSYNLRQHVLAACKDFDIIGSESREIFGEYRLSLSNAEVQAILVEATRPRELILFLAKIFPSLHQ